ncbi:solute carrier family 22 member 6-B-like [Tropilaelaps mercedesae]|uniref:Solute carrier family 22 member 6-B-like n=1 Tax=Tropilaelaps mercedesae TaxID=418985 RepID=A0A1V9XWR1_9ACAR|nr:solute carrier family 22 member 6-B-like [Tropilaelaps mercedesae]
MEDIDVIQVIGRFGIYHGVITVVACLRAFPVAWTNMMSPLMAADVQHWCAPPNATIPAEWWRDHGVPRASLTSSDPSECLMYAWVPDADNRFGGHVDHGLQQPCTHGWAYDRGDFGITATEEWHLVCGDAWKRSAMQSIVMAGSLVGVIVFGRMSDKFGRKCTSFMSAVLLLVTGVSAAFVHSFVAFNAFRFILATATSGLTASLVTMFMEILPEADRIYMNVGFGIGYTLPVMLIPLLSYSLMNFRYMQLAIGLSIFLVLPFFCVIHESPKWLLAKHRFAEAEQAIVRIVRSNRRRVPNMADIMSKLAARAESESAAQSRNLGFIDIMRVPILRRTALTIGLNWFSWSFVSYYFALNAHRLPGNPHLNFAISTFAEIPSAFIAMCLIRKCRRRHSQVFNIMVAAAIFGVVFFLDNGYKGVKVWGNMAARMFVNNYGFIVWVSVHEIYPTPVRGAGYAVAMMFSRLGAGLAPFVKDVGDWTHSTVPCFIILGVCAMIVLCVLQLPETLNRKLPDTIKDVEALYRDTEDPGTYEEIKVVSAHEH